MAQTVIVERQVLSFFYSEEDGAWLSVSSPSLFLPEVDAEYSVYWGGDTYSCNSFISEEFPEAVLLGNPMLLGGADNGIPFLMLSMADGSGMSIMTFDASDSREVGVWIVEEDAQAPSATVKIKGYSGAEHTYENVPKVWLAAPESTAENPILVPFTYGEALDDVEVVPDFSGGDQKVTMPDGYMARSAVVKKPTELVPGNIKAGQTVAGITGEYEGEIPETEELTQPADFSAGDMVLEPSDGKYLSRATVTMPETLLPENIAEGVDIAGIVGELTAGGGNVKIATGTVVGTEAIQTISHNLGVVPDIFIINYGSSNGAVVAAGKLSVVCGISSALNEKANLLKPTFAAGYKGGWVYVGYPDTIDTGTALLYDATDSQITVGSSSYTLYAASYRWLAIGGLT